MTESFELWDSINENILTRAGQLLCSLDVLRSSKQIFSMLEHVLDQASNVPFA